ncbi:hypothetical protein FOZ62_003294, partial [Perkinsus olseni]
MVPSSSSSPPSPASPPPPPPPAAAASGQSQPPQPPPSSQPPTTTSAPKFIDTSSIDLEQLRQVLSLRDPELLKHVETYIRLKNMLDRQARIIESALTGQQPHQQSRFSVLDTATSTPTALSVRPSPDANGNMVLVEEPSDLPQHHHHYQPQPQPITSQPGGAGGLMAMNGTNITGGMEPLDLEALLNNKEETRTTLMMKKIPKYFTVFHLQQALDACCPYVSDEPCYDLLYLPA